jgi:hypothetical protein
MKIQSFRFFVVSSSVAEIYLSLSSGSIGEECIHRVGGSRRDFAIEKAEYLLAHATGLIF